MPWQSVTGADIYYEITGHGPPVLLIHGLGSSLLDWEHQVPSLSERFQVISFDLRGHGRSVPHSEPYTIYQFANDTAALMNMLGIAPVHVVGFSMGGMVAFQLSLNWPKLVKKLVIVNSLPEVKLSPFRAKWEISQRFILTRLLGMRITGQIMSKRIFPEPCHSVLRRTFAARWAENDPNVYLASVQGILGWSVKEQLTSIRCPTLIVAGEKDFFPFEAKESLTRKIPFREMVVIAESGHGSPADHPKEFNNILHEFFSRAN